jgi:hypothetical protein
VAEVLEEHLELQTIEKIKRAFRGDFDFFGRKSEGDT